MDLLPRIPNWNRSLCSFTFTISQSTQMSSKSDIKILVTGASGYVGSLVVDKLKNLGYTVIAYIRDPTKKIYCSSCDAFIIGDIRDTSLLIEAVEKVDYVIHLVAILKPAECDKDPDYCEKVNVDSTMAILNCLGPKQRLIFASTESCIGDIQSAVVDDDNDHNPTTIYGKTKYRAERAVVDRGQIALRFATMFGVSKRHRTDLMTHTIATDAVTTGIIRIYQPEVPRNLLHVTDGAESIVFAVENASLMKGVYNIGSKDLQVKKIQVAEEIRKILENVKIVKIPGQDDNCRLYHLNLDKIYNLGFRPKVGLDEGMRELIEYLKTKDAQN